MAAPENTVVFRSAERQFAVSLSDGVIAEMARICLKSHESETGGILIGRYSDDHAVAIVEQVSGPPPDSQHCFATFFRGIRGLQELLNKLWAKPRKQYYLGEWHYHPLPISTPSGDDIAQMNRIATSNKYACPEPILIIVAGPPIPVCRLAVTVHPVNKAFVTLTATQEATPT